MKSKLTNIRCIELLDPEQFYKKLQGYARVIENNPGTDESRDRLLEKLDEWITEYHSIRDGDDA